MPPCKTAKKYIIKYLLMISVLASTLISGGCSIPTVSGIVDGFNYQNDIELVCDGSSSYLLLLDSMLAKDPTDASKLANTTKAYSAYVNVVEECNHPPERGAVLSIKAKDYALRLLEEDLAIKRSDNLEELTAKLQKTDDDDVESLFWGAYGWGQWISYQQGAPAAVIDLPKLEMIMKRVVELDETFYNGGAHIFLGIYYSLKPSALGGDPEASRNHFERALEIGGRRFLPTQVAYAEYYARMAHDRELYQKLLGEVIAFDISSFPDQTLGNLVAQKQAAKMLEKTDEYF